MTRMVARQRAINCANGFKSYYRAESIREARERRAVPGDEAPAGRRIAVVPTD